MSLRRCDPAFEPVALVTKTRVFQIGSLIVDAAITLLRVTELRHNLSWLANRLRGTDPRQSRPRAGHTRLHTGQPEAISERTLRTSGTRGIWQL